MNPYKDLEESRYWRTGVADRDGSSVRDIYKKRFAIDKTARIVTAGSCFAQHMTRNLRQRGYKVVDTEPAPRALTGAPGYRFGYGLYSARYGNIYTSRQLLQLVQEAWGKFTPRNAVWEKNGRFYDALRPSVEPGGFDSPDQVEVFRTHHVQRVRRAFASAEIFIFTFGLTETWRDKRSGTVFPTAPGVIAGSFDPDQWEFHNLSHDEVMADFLAVRRFLRRRNPDMRFIVTVSPVPLTATASDNHVLTATIYSKSVLRAVAGALSDQFPDVDYFPSYELISTPYLGRSFYEDNMRSVTPEGVEHVMRTFFAEHDPGTGNCESSDSVSAASAISTLSSDEDDAVVCEEALLEAFAR